MFQQGLGFEGLGFRVIPTLEQPLSSNLQIENKTLDGTHSNLAPIALDPERQTLKPSSRAAEHIRECNRMYNVRL